MERQRENTAGLQLAALAHDLRTPMCVAAGAAQMALEAGGRDVSAELRQILTAVGAMERMLSMMSDVPAAGCPAITVAMLEKELLALLGDRARQKGQRLSVDLSALDGLALRADYAALCRLLVNLLGNAIKYTQPGGEITLRAQRSRRRMLFIVADNGMGMTREFMRRMFLPFARAKEAGMIQGSGLGLSIARDMARRLHGTIRVRSEMGKGSTFVVSLPLRGEIVN